MARKNEWGATKRAICRYVRMLCPWRRKEKYLCVENVFKKGSIRPRKHGKTKVWVAQWWDNGQKRSKMLGRFADMPKGEAEAQMALILKPINEAAGRTEKPVYTFTGYL